VTLLPSEKDAIVEQSYLTEPGMKPRNAVEASPAQRDAHGRSSQPNEATNGTHKYSAGNPGNRSSMQTASGERTHAKRSGRQQEGREGHSQWEKSHSGGGYKRRIDESHEKERIRKSWLREGLRVRVVSQTLNRGKAYLSKAVIMNVLGHARCSIQLDSGPVIDVRSLICLGVDDCCP
jgi:hypothetical protein